MQEEEHGNDNLLIDVYYCIITDVTFFKQSLAKYKREHHQAVACPIKKDTGMILVDSEDLKKMLLPSPLRCLEVSKMYMAIIV